MLEGSGLQIVRLRGPKDRHVKDSDLQILEASKVQNLIYIYIYIYIYIKTAIQVTLVAFKVLFGQENTCHSISKGSR